MKKTEIAYIISNSGVINIYKDDKIYTIAKEHINYNKLIEALKKNDIQEMDKWLGIKKTIENYSYNAIKIKKDKLYYKGKELHNAIIKKIFKLIQNDLPFEFMVKFLNNLMKNPSRIAIQELYEFLELANLPITTDGYFLAYKKVRANYKDIFSNTIDNSIGKTLKMSRNKVDKNRNNTCSRGYHFCSLNYLPCYGSDNPNKVRVLIVKINPEDVVAIPKDYNLAKGRCCCYKVIGEYKGNWRNDAFTAEVYTQNGEQYKFKKDKQEYIIEDGTHNEVQNEEIGKYNVRDSKGRFVKKDALNKLNKKQKQNKEVKYHNVRDSKGRFVKKKDKK